MNTIFEGRLKLYRYSPVTSRYKFREYTEFTRIDSVIIIRIHNYTANGFSYQLKWKNDAAKAEA